MSSLDSFPGTSPEGFILQGHTLLCPSPHSLGQGGHVGGGLMQFLDKSWVSAEAYRVQYCDRQKLTNTQNTVHVQEAFKTSETVQDWVVAKMLDHWASNIQQ